MLCYYGYIVFKGVRALAEHLVKCTRCGKTYVAHVNRGGLCNDCKALNTADTKHRSYEKRKARGYDYKKVPFENKCEVCGKWFYADSKLSLCSECARKKNIADNNACRAEKTELDNGMGKMTVLDSTLGETDIDNGMGKIKLTNCVLHDSDIDNGMGEIDLNISGDGEDYRISGDHGDVDIKGRTGSSGAKYKIKIDNGLGDIDISFS